MRSLLKNVIVLIILLVIPVAMYVTYQLSTLNDDEENINLIFQNQLDAILFSVNQYSDDMVSGWIKKIEDAVDSPDSLRESKLALLMNINPGILAVYSADETPDHTITAQIENDEQNNLREHIQRTLNSEVNNLSNLLSYARIAQYQKIESIKIDSLSGDDALMLYFVLSHPALNGDRLGGIVIDPVTYINKSLGIRLKTTAQDKFIISVFRNGIDQPVFSTQDSTKSPVVQSQAVTKNFWLLPDYYLAIGPQSSSLTQVIQQRTQTNLILLVLMILMLSVGGFFLFQNIRREIQLAQNKSEFVANVSHELRTPLALISMFSETLEMNRVRTEEKKREYYGIISKESARLTGIVNRILNFSHIDSDKQGFHLENVELTSLVGDILNTYEFHLSQNGFSHDLILKMPSVEVLADRAAIQEVVINLMDNAIKYSYNVRKIEITVGKSDLMGFIIVKDHGIGIPREEQKYIFQKFYRVSTGDVANTKGTGLGLSLVKSIIDKHGGRIELKSQKGNGSAFTIFLPLKTT